MTAGARESLEACYARNNNGKKPKLDHRALDRELDTRKGPGKAGSNDGTDIDRVQPSALGKGGGEFGFGDGPKWDAL